MNDLEQAKSRLQAENLTCVICGGDRLYTSCQRGVAPLLQLLDAGQNMAGCAAADRVVGKATAFLYCLLGVRAVYAHVMSQPAREVLAQAGIPAEYGTLVPGIRNRRNDGPCPMEEATAVCTEPLQALRAIRQRLAQLQATAQNTVD